MKRMLLVAMGLCVFLPAATQAPKSSQPAKASNTASRGDRPDVAQLPVRSVLEEVVAEPVFQGKCYVYEAGRNNPYTVILVHGLGEGAARDWEHVIPVLAQRYHVVTFDLPGFGRSEKQNALFSPANYAAFVKWIVDERVNGPFTLVGHSMGGVVSLRFASTYPRNLEHLILIDTPGILQRSVAFKSAGRSIADSRFEGPWPSPKGAIDWISGMVLSKMEPLGTILDPEAILASRSYREKFLKGRPDIIAGLALAEEDFSRRLQFVTQPVTLMWGMEDTIAPIRTAKALVAQLPNARLIPLLGMGHSPMTEKPDQFNELLNQNIPAKPGSAAVPPTIIPSERIGRFTDAHGQSVSGAYKILEIENCDDFKLENVTAQSLQIKNSTVSIEGSRIAGGQNALAAYDSNITMTGGLLDADVAVIAERSELDLAGVRIRGKEAIIKTGDWAKFVFSISQASLGNEAWHLHGVEKLSAETSPWPKSAR